MTESEAATVVERKWATQKLEQVLKKEAFVNTLRANLNKLTQDIKVGTRFISTLDYDGNLYECKQKPYTEYLTLPVVRPKTDDSPAKIIEGEKRVELVEVDITAHLAGDDQVRLVPGHNLATADTPELRARAKELKGKTVVLRGRSIRDKVVEAKWDIRSKRYWEEGGGDVDAPNEVEFHIVDTTVFNAYYDLNGNRLPTVLLSVRAYGYFPELVRQTSRIWVRKCNIVASAFGKNIDSSKRCINFTLEKMSVRKMLQQEVDKLEKIRKVFNKNNPSKSRSVQLKELKEEHDRLTPTLNRLEMLFYDLYGKDVNVDAYYCKKYGYLIPIQAEFVVDLSGNTVEQTIIQQNDQAREQIDQQLQLRNQVVEEVLPAALHPERVERQLEKHDIDGTFGDDEVIVSVYIDGKLKTGVVNKSVFG